jgi:hypothetical protein
MLVLLLLFSVMIVPGSARGQAGFQLTPSVSMTEAYDSNVFSAASNQVADFVTHVTPAIDSQYESPLVTFAGHYALDAERFTDHPDLNTADGRQNATVDVHYRPTRRFVLATDAGFTRTYDPGELNAESGLQLTRALAQRVSVHSSLTHQLDRTIMATIEYSFTEDRLRGFAGRGNFHAHVASMGVERSLSARDVTAVHYAIQRFEFGPGTFTTSQALIVGWKRQLTHETSLTLSGGPRLTDGRTAPEISAAIHTRTHRVDLSLGYARTQTTVVGLAGSANVQGVTAAAQAHPWRLLQIRMEPGVFQTAHMGLQTRVYRVAFKASCLITKTFSIVTTYDVNLQHGNVYPTIGFDGTSRHIVSVSVMRARSSSRH